MKRSRPKEEGKLGANEFATILNGDDGRQIWIALRKFKKTIQKERRQALSIGADRVDDDHDDEDHLDESESESDASGIPGDESSFAKRTKFDETEEWMKDTESYNVPFVGTSVAKGDTGSVLPGQWPTGFIKAYLERSPFAAELLGADLIPPHGHVHKKLLRQKNGKLSFAIYKAYLEALSELLTAAIPLPALQRGYGLDVDGFTGPTKTPQFVSIFRKDRYPDILVLLNEQLGCGKGRTGSVAGVGPLALICLEILTNATSVGLGTAKEVASGLDSSLVEGTLKILMREPRKELKEQKSDPSVLLGLPYKTRAACLALATGLLETKDPTVVSYISTPGSRERKINPGILFMALRYGLSDSLFVEQEVQPYQEVYIESLAFLLDSIKNVFFVVQGEMLSNRSLANLMAGDVLQNICRISSCVPPHNIDNKLSSLQEAGVKAGDLLELLLRSETSPFTNRFVRNSQLSVNHSNMIMQALNTLLATSRNHLISHSFVARILSETCSLFPAFSKNFKISEPSKEPYRFLAQMRLLTRIFGCQPAVKCCDDDKDTVLLLIPNNLKRSVASKAMQNRNPLVAGEICKLLCMVLQRYREMPLNERVGKMLLQRLPDFQAILAARVCFDPFTAEEPRQRSCVIVHGLICRLLSEMARTFPHNPALDSTKMIPDNVDSFLRGSHLAQIQLLSCVGILTKLGKANHAGNHAISKCIVTLEIVLRSKHISVYERAREITIELLRRQITADMNGDPVEQRICHEYEFSCWIDGLTLSMLHDFKAMLLQVTRNLLDHTIVSSQSLKVFALEGIGIFHTPFLTHALSSTIPSTELQQVALSVAARSVLFHMNPLSLAAVVCYGDKAGDSSPLSSYCRMLISCAASTAHEKQVRLSVLLTKSLSSESLAFRLQSHPSDFHVPEHYVEAGIRQCLHLILLTESSSKVQKYVTLLRHLLSRSMNSTSKTDYTCLYNHPFIQSSAFDRIFIRALLKHRGTSATVGFAAEPNTAGGTHLILQEALLAYTLQDKPPTMVTQILRAFVDEDPSSIDRKVLGSVLVGCEMPLSKVPCRLIFQAWLQAHPSDWQVRMALESTMLSYDSAGEVRLLSMASSVPTNGLARACFEAVRRSRGSKMLAKLVEIGHTQLGLLLLDLVSTEADHRIDLGESWDRTEIMALWKEGCIDPALSVLLVQNSNYPSSKITALVDSLSCRGSTFEFVGGVFGGDIFCKDCYVSSSLVQLLLKSFDTEQLPVLTRLVMSLLDDDPGKNRQVLRDVFCFLLGSLPKQLKAFFRSPTLSSCSIDSTMELVKRLLEDTALDIQDRDPDFDAVIKSCLKYGLNADQRDKMIVASQCIELVRLLLDRLLVSTTTPRQSRELKERQISLDPSHVFMMVVSHSKFVSLPTSSGSGVVFLEAVKLLVCCASLKAQIQSIETDILDTLIGSYGCGMRELDLHLRKFLDLYFTECSTVPFSNNIYRKIWGSPRVDLDFHTESWEFLLNSLNYGRIRATLNQFPKHSSMRPFSQRHHDMAQETAAAVEDFQEECRHEGAKDGTDLPHQSELVPEDVWAGPGPDNRYDPAFVLPAIFGALEHYSRGVVSEETPLESDQLTGEVSKHKSVALSNFAQRLADRGALSLTIGCLCSSCEGLRKLAISTLGIFTMALNSDEAKGVKAWRDRPQLGLLVNSIRRGLVSRKQMLSSLGHQETVPKMNPLCAVFLAQSALVLSKPGDPMFGAVNHYFLKLDEANGAFTDFNRLPAFVPLFCSTSDESDQSQKDRAWALSLLKDGFVDPSCFRLVSTCHAPELLLTTLEHATMNEQSLILDVIHRLLLFGGQAASVHLVDRLGLLCLFRSLVLGHKFQKTSVSCKQTLCAVVGLAIERGERYSHGGSKDQLASEICMLLQPLVEMFLYAQRGSNLQGNFAPDFCELFSKMAKVHSALSPKRLHFTPCGLTVRSALEFLRACPEQHKASMVYSVNVVPLAVLEVKSAVDLSRICLASIDGTNVTTALRRFRAILQNCTGEWDDEGEECLQLLMHCSTLGQRYCRENYFDCVELLIRKRGARDLSSLSDLANSILKLAETK